MADTPETPQRARRVGKDVTHEALLPTYCPHCGATLFVQKGRCGVCKGKVSGPPKQRLVYDKWPLKRLYMRGALGDDDTGRRRYLAGWRYYEHWYLSGLTPIGSADMAGVYHRGDPCYGMAATERQAYHRGMFRKGKEALGSDFSAYVDAIVLHERTPEEVGKRLTGRTPQHSSVIATEFLRAGLDRLAKAFGLGAK